MGEKGWKWRGARGKGEERGEGGERWKKWKRKTNGKTNKASIWKINYFFAVGQRPAGRGTERIKGFVLMKRPGIRVRDVREGLRLGARRIGTDAQRHGSRWRRTFCGVRCFA